MTLNWKSGTILLRDWMANGCETDQKKKKKKVKRYCQGQENENKLMTRSF